MDITTYVALAGRTDLSPEQYDAAHARLNGDNMRLLHACFGLMTELGEIMDTFKRHVFYGQELDITNLIEEAGDEGWYFAKLMSFLYEDCGMTPPDILKQNIAKLQARYPEKFTEEMAIARLDKKQ